MYLQQQDSLKIKSSIADVISYTIFGRVSNTETNNTSFKMLSQGILSNGVNGVYSVNAEQEVKIETVFLCNNSSTVVNNIEVYVNGSEIENKIIGGISIPPNGTATYNTNQQLIIHDATGIIVTESISNSIDNSFATYISGSTYTIVKNNTHFNPSTLIPSLTVTFPSIPYDGQVLRLNFGGTIAEGQPLISSLSFVGGDIYGGFPTSLSGGDNLQFIYISSVNQWQRTIL